MRKLFVYVFLHIRVDFCNIRFVDNRKIYSDRKRLKPVTVIILKAASKPEIIRRAKFASDDPAFIRIFHIKRIENAGIFNSLFRKFIHGEACVLKNLGVAVAVICQLSAFSFAHYVVPKACPFVIDVLRHFFGGAKLFADIKVLLELLRAFRTRSCPVVVHIVAILEPQKPKPSAVVIRELLCYSVVGFFAS